MKAFNELMRIVDYQANEMRISLRDPNLSIVQLLKLSRDQETELKMKLKEYLEKEQEKS